jgi:hypothetical protein
VRADVTPAVPAGAPPALARLAARLAGPGQARFSSAFARGGAETADILGVGLRLGPAGIQDLMLGTFDSFWLPSVLRARRQTDVHDYLANTYRSVARYHLEGLGEVALRLRPCSPSPGGTGRAARLDEAMRLGQARLVLELRPRGEAGFVPVVELALVGRSSVKDARLRLSVDRDGAGLRAIGVLAGVRRVAYPLSQRLGRDRDRDDVAARQGRDRAGRSRAA